MLEGPGLVCRLYAVVPAEEAAGLRARGFGGEPHLHQVWGRGPVEEAGSPSTMTG